MMTDSPVATAAPWFPRFVTSNGPPCRLGADVARGLAEGTFMSTSEPATAAPKYGEPTPDPLDEAWREFILTVGHALHLDRVVVWLGRRLGAGDGE